MQIDPVRPCMGGYSNNVRNINVSTINTPSRNDASRIKDRAKKTIGYRFKSVIHKANSIVRNGAVSAPSIAVGAVVAAVLGEQDARALGADQAQGQIRDARVVDAHIDFHARHQAAVGHEEAGVGGGVVDQLHQVVVG